MDAAMGAVIVYPLVLKSSGMDAASFTVLKGNAIARLLRSTKKLHGRMNRWA
jgi:hypothetical protein